MATILYADVATPSSAFAADLGGDCCPDLEERVAELEATTVRHANRKISLTLSGQVSQQLLWYDNREESDLYVIDNDESSTRLNLKGSGAISPGWSAGFQIEVDLQMGNNFGPAENDNDDGDTFQFRRAEWWVKSDQLGTVTLGQGSMASDDAFEVSFSNATLGGTGYGLAVTNTYFDVFDTVSQTYLGVEWVSIGTDTDESRNNRVRYDSPTFVGFTFSSSWGEDDEWDVALWYAKEWNGIATKAAVSYHEDLDDGPGCVTGTAATPPSFNTGGGNGANCLEFEKYGGSIAFQHVPTGIHVQGGYAHREAERANPALVGFANQPDAEHWWVAAGIGFTTNSLGATDITATYIQNENVVVGYDYDSWAIGIGQDIDAIGAQFYASYIYHEADDNVFLGRNIASEFDQVNVGMLVKY